MTPKEPDPNVFKNEQIQKNRFFSENMKNFSGSEYLLKNPHLWKNKKPNETFESQKKNLVSFDNFNNLKSPRKNYNQIERVLFFIIINAFFLKYFINNIINLFKLSLLAVFFNL